MKSVKQNTENAKKSKKKSKKESMKSQKVAIIVKNQSKCNQKEVEK